MMKKLCLKKLCLISVTIVVSFGIVLPGAIMLYSHYVEEAPTVTQYMDYGILKITTAIALFSAFVYSAARWDLRKRKGEKRDSSP